MQETDHITQLLKKSIEGALSPAEDAELRAWADNDSSYQALLNRLHDIHSLEELLLRRYELERNDSRDYVDQLQEALTARIAISQKKSKSHRISRWLPYTAAAILIAAIITTLTFFDNQKNVNEKFTILDVVDIGPGTNRATLTLADGRAINLSEAHTGVIIKGEDVTYNDGASLAAIPVNKKGAAIQMELSTPFGGTYQITLPDGTKVWLNSASTLKYPSHFDDDERTVELIGEAYFDVTKVMEQKNTKRKAWPFKVISAGQTIEVLGTEFNVTAYTDEPETKTTLVEGSVQIVNHASKTVSQLQVGEQGINRGENITIKRVDVDQFTAWKDGFFYFDGLAPNIAFSQLERWYDIEVIYEGNTPSIGFFGMIDRSKPLSSVLQTLEKSGLKFQVGQSNGKNKLMILGENKNITK